MVSIEWTDVTVFAQVYSKKRSWFSRLFKRKSQDNQPSTTQRLLREVSGNVDNGQLLAIVGPSGAGRTTLLNALSNRMSSDLSMTGEILLNGSSRLANKIPDISGYVQESDILIGRLTVKEHLWFQASVRLGSWTSAQRNQRVDDVIRQLGLKKCEHTVIGIVGVLKGISGGERKRLCVGTELLDDPKLLFCDEPTVGLDSFMAENVVRTLKAMAETGKTIVCTIRTMSSEVYSLFSNVMLMCEGRVVFQGHPNDALRYFEQMGHRCPDTYNPADFFNHLLTIRSSSDNKKYTGLMQLCDRYQTAIQEIRRNQYEINKIHKADQLPDVVAMQKGGETAGMATQFHALLWRAWTTNLRNIGVYRLRLITITMMALVTGMCFFQLNVKDTEQKDVMDISGALNSLMCINWDNSFTMISSFYGELDVFRKEHSNGLYSSVLYYITRVLAAVPHFLLLGTIWVMITYWSMGFDITLENFLTIYGTLILCLWTACAYGCFLAMLFRGDLDLTINAGPMPLVVYWMAAGFFINLESLPAWFSWVQYVNWLRYSFDALMVSQWTLVKNISCEYEQQDMCFQTGKDVLHFYHLGESFPFWQNYLWMTLLMLGFHLAASVAIWWANRGQRSKKIKQ